MGKTANKTKEQLETERAARRASFVKVGQQRVAKAVKAISLIGNLANSRGYAFAAPDVLDIKMALGHEVQRVIDLFNNALAGKTTVRGTTFQFGGSAEPKK